MAHMECAVCGSITDCREMTGCRACKKAMCFPCAEKRRGICNDCGNPDAEVEYQNDGHEPPAF